MESYSNKHTSRATSKKTTGHLIASAMRSSFTIELAFFKASLLVSSRIREKDVSQLSQPDCKQAGWLVI